MSRLSIDPFQQNRRLSETTLLDLHSPTRKGHHEGGHHRGGHRGHHGGNGGSCQSRSESHSVAQSPPFENISTASSLDSDNPFQNDQLPVWQNRQASSSSVRPKARGHGGSSTMTPTSPSETSSPDNNYGGQGRAYCYQNLNETPLSPDLVNHRQRQHVSGLSPPSSPVAQVIQVSRTYIFF